VGGFSESVTVDNENGLDNDHKGINAFIRSNVPEVKGLDLISYRQQIVAGVNYCYTYGTRTGSTVSNSVELCVWSKPWENNFLRVKRPNGEVVVSGGLP
jgi:hypothetical protein